MRVGIRAPQDSDSISALLTWAIALEPRAFGGWRSHLYCGGFLASLFHCFAGLTLPGQLAGIFHAIDLGGDSITPIATKACWHSLTGLRQPGLSAFLLFGIALPAYRRRQVLYRPGAFCAARQALRGAGQGIDSLQRLMARCLAGGKTNVLTTGPLSIPAMRRSASGKPTQRRGNLRLYGGVLMPR